MGVVTLLSTCGSENKLSEYVLFRTTEAAIINKTRLITMESKPIVLYLFYFSLGLFVGVVWWVWFGRFGLVGLVW